MAMFKTGRLCLEMGSFFAGMMVSRGIVQNTDIILGPSYKGSSIALATTIALWKDHGLDLLFDYDRKEVKAHGEASAYKSLFVNRTFFDECRIFVVDDVATSMGTKYDLLEKIDEESRVRKMTFHVVGVGIGIDREQSTAVYDRDGSVIPGLKGDNAIQEFVTRSSIPVYSVTGIRGVITYLYQEKIPVMINGDRRPIDEETKVLFDEYYEVYGVD
jgi:orotate phosphoribosyltransferase